MNGRDYRVGYVSQFWLEDDSKRTEDERWARYETMLQSQDWCYDTHDSECIAEAGVIRAEIIDRLRTELSKIDERRATDLYNKYCPY